MVAPKPEGAHSHNTAKAKVEVSLKVQLLLRTFELSLSCLHLYTTIISYCAAWSHILANMVEEFEAKVIHTDEESHYEIAAGIIDKVSIPH